MNVSAIGQRIWQKTWVRKALKVLALTFGGLILLILIVDDVVMPWWTRHGDEIPSPNLIGQSLENAQEIVNSVSGSLEIVERRYSADYPDGVIIDQQPGPQHPIKEGRIFRIVISRGSQLTDVPRVRGQTIRQAELILQEAGFVVGGRARSEDASLPTGTVVGTVPSAGSRLPRKSVVNLLVNADLREDYTWCPDLSGMNIEEARMLLRERHLLVGRVDRRYDRELESGTILEQSVRPGEEVPTGTEIDLVISRDR